VVNNFTAFSHIYVTSYLEIFNVRKAVTYVYSLLLINVSWCFVGPSVPLSAPVSSTKSAPGTGQTKDDAYDSFMKEIEGIM